MNKQDNPFYTLAELISNKEDTISQINIGNVISTEPLLIVCNGIQLDKNDIWINKTLLKGYKQVVEIEGTKKTIENTENILKAGSTVALITKDNQKFIVLCEVI